MRISKIDNPTSGHFVLPQQRELYLQLKEDERLISMSVIDQDELETIRDSVREDYVITVTWWKQVGGNLGSTCSMWGVDQQGRLIKLVNDTGAIWIRIDYIIYARTE